VLPEATLSLGRTGNIDSLECAVDNQNDPVVRTANPPRRPVSVVRLLIYAVLGLVLGLLIYHAPSYLIKEEPQQTYPRLRLGGTSTAFVVVENLWKVPYRDKKGVELSYESTGSTTGTTRLLDGTYAIAFTHGPLSQEQRQKALKKGEVIHFPVLLCGVAPIYNVKELKGKTPLQLTGELLADIFLGKVQEWNHPDLKALNPGVELPATKITVVHRQDSSGTTHIFADYLSMVSEAWREKMGPPASVLKWPTGIAAPRNLGVAHQVYQTEGAIGYVDRTFTAFEEGVFELDYAAVQNKDNSAFVRPEPANMAAAAAASIQAGLPEDLSQLHLANQPGKDAYPISGVIYAVCYQIQPADTRQRLVDFLRFATHVGQPAENRSYAPLPPELVTRIDKKLDEIKAAQ
jgi:phosphate transport system substrate-binding protein